MERKRRIILAMGCVTLFLTGANLFVISPLLPEISESLQVGASTAGWMVTVFSIMFAISAPFLGWLSDKKGRKQFIVLGLLLFAISNALTSMSSSLPLLLLSRILAGLSVAAINPQIYAMASDIAPPGRKGTWMSIVISGHLTSLWIGAPIGTVLGYYLGWRSVFAIMAALGGMLAIIHLRASGSAQARPPSLPLQGNFRTIARSISVTAVWASSMYMLYVYLGAALYANHYSSFDISIAVICYGVGAVAGSLSSGRLTDRYGARSVCSASFLLLIMILFALGMGFSSRIGVNVGLSLWALVGYAGFTSYQARLAADHPAQRGFVLAWNTTALYVGITIGSLLGGYIIDYSGYSDLPYFCSAIAAVTFLLNMRRRGRPPVMPINRSVDRSENFL